MASAETAGVNKIQCGLGILLDHECTTHSRFLVKYLCYLCGAAFSELNYKGVEVEMGDKQPFRYSDDNYTEVSIIKILKIL